MNETVHARRLRWFVPRDGTALAQLEEDREAAQQEEEMDREAVEDRQEEQDREEVVDEQE